MKDLGIIAIFTFALVIAIAPSLLATSKRSIGSIIDSIAPTKSDSPSPRFYAVRIRGVAYSVMQDPRNGYWYALRAGEVVAVSGYSRRELEAALAVPHRNCAHVPPPGFAPCTGELDHEGPCALWPGPGYRFEDLFA